MFVYIDESGNSGLNNFDEQQPYLFYLAIISNLDLDAFPNRYFEIIKEKIGNVELHANELGMSTINNISRDIVKVLNKFKIKFVFYAIEKKYIVATKLFDAIFDSFDNPSVPWHIYNIGFLRNLLLIYFFKILDIETAIMFWDGCITEKNNETAKKNFNEVCHRLLNNTDIIRDKRAKQIIIDALSSAIIVPENMLFYLDSKIMRKTGSANFIGFSSIMAKIAKIAKKRHRFVKKFTHDTQDQFKDIFIYYYNIMQNSEKINHNSIFGVETLDFRWMKHATIFIKESKDSISLQYCDICLFLLKKDFFKDKIFGDAAYLLSKIKKSCILGRFDSVGLVDRTNAEILALNNLQLTDSNMKDGKKLLNKSEELRLDYIKKINSIKQL